MHLLLSHVNCCVERECPQQRFTSTLVSKIVANPLSLGREFAPIICFTDDLGGWKGKWDH